MFEFNALSEHLGAEVIGIDASQEIAEAVRDELRSLLARRSVLLLRDQQLTIPQQIAFTSVFGTVAVPWDNNHKHPHDPRIQIISNAGRQNITYKTSTLYWHSDQSFTAEPTMATMLYAIAVPSCGGNTLFVNMRRAYDLLPEEQKLALIPLAARHSFCYRMMDLTRRRISEDAAQADSERFPDVYHPLVRQHPVTGQMALFLNELCVDRLTGLTEAEGKDLLERLFAHCLQPTNIYSHHWKINDLLIWDNASLMHRAEDIPIDSPRVFHRTNTLGGVPT